MRPYRWPDCPASVHEAVDGFVTLVRGLSGASLVGVYLHGSLAMGGFNPGRSDLDLLVVTRSDPGATFRRALAAWLLQHSGHPYPFEVHVLQMEDLHPWRHPAPFAFHYSEAWRQPTRDAVARLQDPRELMPATDPDLAAHVTVLRARGVCLCGQPIDEVFPQVPPEDYRDGLLRDVSDARSTVHLDPVSTVLNLCRVGQYLEDGVIASKAEAGAWAAMALPAAHRSVAAWALAAYRGDAASKQAPSEVRLAAFVHYMMGRLGLSSTRLDENLARGRERKMPHSRRSATTRRPKPRTY
ncbi:aminoglycoside adenylyltransferase domain-containing protein [Geochorda subterranea]|uniref:Aminoglycoside adenylyltransferase domain-containing protein n=1 Tax=Geochorda subterranea TaxID=3109564 RepID=A0ABZ1BQ93_9FIRM|nr:aminoglycoside adenylyltransferase domain-containing protein [Limnochorda sp. LNt]WRP14581.1 aminoglycoside adenylyltransferase domain-containing protein [Limnochorda sp. LNt]